MRLTTEQVDTIRREMDQHAIRIDTLREDLLDHLCCAVEHKLSFGKSFEAAFREALLDLAPNGLNEIEHETLFLLNYNNLMNMKKLMFLSGSLFSILFSVGFFMKALHWSNAGDLMSYGAAGLVLVFVPLLVLHYFRSQIARVMSERLKFILGVASAVLIGTGTMMKLNHLPGADMCTLVGGFIFSFGFIPFLFYRMYKQSIA